MPTSAPPSAFGSRSRLVLLGVGAVALLAHALAYRFLCDDAYISFRYARNLADGYGLVFNPGLERVEGYTNFLWVLVLAAFDWVGVQPERAAVPLSLLATLGLYAVVAWRSWRDAIEGEPFWIAALPCLFLAITRSVAVWSTSGLETRLFELLVVSGTLRLLHELAQEESGAPPRIPWSGALFALGALTRPDGILLGGAALGAAAAPALIARRFVWKRWTARFAAFLVPIAAHLAFRLAYYGEWVPNTYQAKVGGRAWWSMGFRYLASFAVEYLLVLALVLALAGALSLVRRGRRTDVAVFAAVVIPHVIYVASVGGDHFEYRPLDLYFPFLFLLVAEGLRAWIAAGRRTSLAGLLAIGVAFGLVWFPLQARVQYRWDRYRVTFPGGATDDGVAEAYLDPTRDPIFHLPGLRLVARTWRDLLCATTPVAVGIRWEEHRHFLSTVLPEAREFRRRIDAGELPRVLVGLHSVGALPYITDLPTIDRLGLTDATVARAPIISQRRYMAHDKRDVRGYVKSRGVQISGIVAAHLLFTSSDSRLPRAVGTTLGGTEPTGFADLGGGYCLVARLPQGIDSARRAFPRFRFYDLSTPEGFRAFVDYIVAAQRAVIARDPIDALAWLALGQVLLLGGNAPDALPAFERAAALEPDRISPWIGLAGARAATGDPDAALDALTRARALAERRHATAVLEDIDTAEARVRQPPPTRAR